MTGHDLFDHLKKLTKEQLDLPITFQYKVTDDGKNYFVVIQPVTDLNVKPNFNDWQIILT